MAALLDELLRMDTLAAEGVQALRWGPLTAVLTIASAWWVKGLVIVGAGAVRDVRSRLLLPVAAVSGAVAFGVASGVVALVKDAVDRARPAIADPAVQALVATPDSSSFPSGHAATAFAAATAVGLVYRRLLWPLLGLAALIAFSRVYLGVHYALDVLAGAALGAAIGVAVTWLLRELVGDRIPSGPPLRRSRTST